MRRLHRWRRVWRILKRYKLGGREGGLAEELDESVAGARYVETACATILLSTHLVVHTKLLGLLLLDGKLY